MSVKAKKQGFVYDSDDGLMEEIHKLTAPPGKMIMPKIAVVPEKETPVSQKNWKSVNTQYCIVCREGGELLCCDTCPASFHLLCHQPVIWRDEIPEGNWMCNRCQNTAPEELQTKEALDPNVSEECRNRLAAIRAMSGSESSDDPLSLLAKAALVVNAQQFELPRELVHPDRHLPNDELRVPKQNIYGDWCSHCQSKNSTQPLVACDFCPLRYHLDCLAPPLCSQPKERWMCPNHVESVVDQKLLKTMSIVDRRALWDKYARQELDEIAITRTFIEKAGVARRKRKIPRGIEVRGAIKDLYRRRWDGGAEEKVQFATEEERRCWIDTLVAMHTSATAARLADAQARESAKKLRESEKGGEGPDDEKMQESEKDGEGPEDERLQESEKGGEGPDDERRRVSAPDEHVASSSAAPPTAETLVKEDVDDEVEEEMEVDLASPESSSVSDDVIVSQLLHRLLDTVAGKRELSPSCSTSTPTMTSSTPPSPPPPRRYLSPRKREELVPAKSSSLLLLEECQSRLAACHDPTERQLLLLAVERLCQLERVTTVRQSSEQEEGAGPGRTVNQRPRPQKCAFETRLFLPSRPIIAVLKPEGDEHLPLAVQRAVTTIGTSEHCHILLNSPITSDVYCAAVAKHHAAIVFDKVSRHFELQLYGNERALVDGVWYGMEYGSCKMRCACAAMDQDQEGAGRAIDGTLAAPLRHGSHISIGCNSFVFASFY